jgi:uncharacterized protein (DUF697 family)
MTADQKEKCQVIIHGASVAAGGVGAGLAQLPVADAAVLIPMQIGMIIALGKVFNVDITEAAAKGLALGMAGMWIGRTATQLIAGWIPGLGNALNAATAAGLTEAMGWAVAKRFEKGEIPNR